MPKTKLDELDFTNTDEIVCPYCGHEKSDSWEMADQEDSYECGDCGETFSYVRNISVSYTSQKKQCKENEHDYSFERVWESTEDFKRIPNTNNFEWVKREYPQHYKTLKCSICDHENSILITEDEYTQLKVK